MASKSGERIVNNSRLLITKWNRLALTTISLATLVACAAPPAAETTAVTKPEGASDLVMRSLPNPTADEIGRAHV